MAASLKCHGEKHSYLNVNKSCLQSLNLLENDNLHSKVKLLYFVSKLKSWLFQPTLDFGDYFVQRWHVVFFNSEMPKVLVWARSRRFIKLKNCSNFENSQRIFCNYQTLHWRAPKNQKNSFGTSTRRGLGCFSKFWFHIRILQ